MEEESEKNLLPSNQVELVEEENTTNETLLQAETEKSVEEEEIKRPSPKTKFFKLFERKKISSSESTECPLKETEPKRPRFALAGFFNKFRRGRCNDARCDKSRTFEIN